MVVIPGDATDVLAGRSYPDPYRALEDGSDPAVAAWQREQAARADAYVAGLSGVGELRESVDRFMAGGRGSVPRFAGGRWFRSARPSGRRAEPGDVHIVVAGEPFGDGRVVFESARHADERGRTPVVSWVSPSPDGRLLAVGLCFDGSEANTIRVVDVASGRLLADRPPKVVMDNWLGGAQWLGDSSGFLYVALDGPAEAFELRVFRHDIGRPARPEPEPVPLAEGAGLDRYIGVFVSRDGRWALVCQDLIRPRPVAVRDLSDAAGSWRPVRSDIEAAFAGEVVAGEYVAVTDHDAPRGRVVAAPLAEMAASGRLDPASWRVVVPESDAVLGTAVPVGDRLYVTELVGTYARVRVFDRGGTELERVPLPGRGALAEPGFPLLNAVPRGHPEEFVFAFSSFTESWGTYRHLPGESAVETLAEPGARIEALVEDLWATSADGTRVPYHLVRRPDVPADVPRPTLIYAYGGYNRSLTPQFPRAMAALVEAGGVFVHGHIRGGGEFGRDWWRGGNMRNKANGYADLFAIAEDLIARGRTSPDRLAVTGGSNGGHMAGVAVTRRPDLWCAAVPRVPVLDLVGACRHPYGRAAIAADIADPGDPEDVACLAAISPYHLVEDGVAYPAVFLDVGATDARCPAWHGRKFAARLQAATSSDRPVLLRVWDDVGHGWATPREVEVRQHTAWLAFVLDRLGLGGTTR
jgi:prolyl oligopeptidase